MTSRKPSKTSNPPAAPDLLGLPPAHLFTEALLVWFTAHARSLPWRQDRNGYRVWVSEVMLQQTRVATVIPYFERFFLRFPDVPALAAADLADVLALWSGLGYYRRARTLHEGAKDVVARFGGIVPQTVLELRSLRGVGPYTAGAIASLAFGQPEPIVDGNVMRVYARVMALADDLKSSRTQRHLWAIAAALVPARSPGPFNEALMELGATVCLPRNPTCLVCPVRTFCTAWQQGRQGELPVVGKSKAVPTVFAAALVDRRSNGILLGRRRTDALFGGLWEPPMIEAAAADEAVQALNHVAPGASPRGAITHVLSHRRMEVSVLIGVAVKDAAYPAVYEEMRVVAEADLPSYGISTLAKKVLTAAAPHPKRPEPSLLSLTSPFLGNLFHGHFARRQ